MLARSGIELAAVHADHTQRHQLQLLGQEKNLKKALGNRPTVLAPEGRDRVMVRVAVGRHKAHPEVATGRALDPTAREDSVGIAVDQKRQHHPGVILRRAAAATVHLEGAHVDALDRLDHEVRQIVLRDPIPKIGRKQESLVPPAIHESAHRRILTEHHTKVRQTVSVPLSQLLLPLQSGRDSDTPTSPCPPPHLFSSLRRRARTPFAWLTRLRRGTLARAPVCFAARKGGGGTKVERGGPTGPEGPVERSEGAAHPISPPLLPRRGRRGPG